MGVFEGGSSGGSGGVQTIDDLLAKLPSIDAGSTADVSPADLGDLSVLAYSPRGLDVMVASATAMSAIAASATAMAAVTTSAIAMDKVAASAVAMDAVTTSSVAMDAVVTSTLAMTAVAASATAMSRVAASAVAMGAVAANGAALAIVMADAAAKASVMNSPLAVTVTKASTGWAYGQTIHAGAGLFLMIQHGNNYSGSEGIYINGGVISASSNVGSYSVITPYSVSLGTTWYYAGGYIKYIPL